MFLLDTNVVSEIRRPRPHGGVLAWLAADRTARLCLSAVTIGELQTGIERMRPNDPERAPLFESWLETIVATSDVLPVDAETFRLAGRLMHGRSDDLLMDALIAATASVQNLTVVTRNTKDFSRLDVPSIDPFRYDRA